jgi:acyl-CoA thioesterase FadM
VHFTVFFRYMEEAEHALWRAAGLSIARAGEETGFPRLETSCAFHAPLRFEDEFDVTVRITSLGRRAIRYAFRMTRGDTLIATGALATAHVSRRPGEPMKALDLPPQVVERFAVDPEPEDS